MITNIEQLLQDYASYSFMEGKIDENTMNRLIEDAQNYIDKLNELKLLSLHNVVGQNEQLANFCKKISRQEDCPVEFQDIVNKEFWNLIG